MTILTRSVSAAALMTLASLSVAHADSFVFAINANGMQEVNSSGVPVGDMDGLATGTLLLNNGTGGNTGFAQLNVQLSNIAYPLTGWHIHQAPSTTTGPIVLDFGNPENIRVGDSLVATITGLSSSTIDNVFANPSGFYFNLHNTAFRPGAVRHQLQAPVPEPGSVALLCGMAALGGMVLRRKSRK
jgi:hypothetical protein